MSYKIGNCTFETKEAKEAWQLETVITDIDYVLKYSGDKLSFTDKELFRISKRTLKN